MRKPIAIRDRKSTRLNSSHRCISYAVFCLIFAWNEYAFAALLTSGEAQTAPPFIPTIIGEGGQDWPAVAAGTTIFLIPILVFTILLRKQLLRGITFGAIRK